MNFGLFVDSFSIPSNSRPFDSRPKVVLSKLRTLKIYGGLSLDHNSLILLKNLSTPALRHFAYQHINSPHPPWTDIPFIELSSSLEIFHSFFQRLNEPLEELDFATDSLETRYLLELLSLFPKLRRLSLRFAFVTLKSSLNDRLLLGFIPYEHKRRCRSCSLEDGQVEELDSLDCLCPKLEVFDVDDASFSKHVLLEYLQLRLVNFDKYNITRLRRFAISFDFRSEDHDTDLMGEIDRLAEEAGIVDMCLRRRLDNQFLGGQTEPNFD
jgi:hypothetical protein